LRLGTVSSWTEATSTFGTIPRFSTFN
jgi:hypothetical protein